MATKSSAPAGKVPEAFAARKPGANPTPARKNGADPDAGRTKAFGGKQASPGTKKVKPQRG